MNKVDLHIHTTFSDGSKTPEEIVNMCINKNITTMAITDHDNIEGSKWLIKNHPASFKVLSGVELTIKVPKGRFHLLGYNFDLDNQELNSFLEETRQTSIYNLLVYIEILKKDYHLPITEDDIKTIINKPGNIGRPDIAALLIQKKICKSVEETFDKYLRPAYEKASKVKKGITPEEGISLIRRAGGTPVLAHPNSLLLGIKELDSEIKYLSSIGLKGLETIHINETPEQRKLYHSLAEKYHLLESGGTDYHGDSKPDVEIGTGRNNNISIREGQLTLLKKIKPRY